MKNEKHTKLNKFWSHLWKLLKPSHKRIKILVVLTMIFELSRFVDPYILKMIIDLIVNFSDDKISLLISLIILMFIVSQFVALIDYILDKKIGYVVSDVEKYLPINAEKKMLYLPLNFHEKENTGNKISKIQRGVDKVVNFLCAIFWDICPTIIQVILTTIILFVVDFRFGIIFLFFLPLFILLTLKGNKKVYVYRKKRHDEYEKSSGQMAQSIININTVKSFVQEKREMDEFVKVRKSIKNNFFTEFATILKYNWSRGLIVNVGRVVVLFFGIYLVSTNEITVGSLVFIVTISEKAFSSLFRISRLYDKIMESSEAIDRLYLLDKEKSNIINKKNGIKPKKIIGQIKFSNVNFAYDKNERKALRNINLKINSDCITALVGPSGGGKTTLARMIYRHYDPQEGGVFLDDKNLKDYDLYTFRRFISIVPQEVDIFNASISDNIAYAKPYSSIEEIKSAAKIANAEEFIEKMPKKYKTKVGERGIKLSGGQRQRIGIARAILANPRILIFDEATSSLDSYSEKLIQDAMDKISRGRTVILIAHRLSTIKKADKIIVLENGKVAEQGSHYELSKINGGLYSKLLKLQEVGHVG